MQKEKVIEFIKSCEYEADYKPVIGLLLRCLLKSGDLEEINNSFFLDIGDKRIQIDNFQPINESLLTNFKYVSKPQLLNYKGLFGGKKEQLQENKENKENNVENIKEYNDSQDEEIPDVIDTEEDTIEDEGFEFI